MMPIEMQDLDGGLGILVTGSGVVTEEEFVVSYKKHLLQDESKFKKYRYHLSDHTAVTKVEVPTKALEVIAKLSKEASKVNPDAVLATVADQDLIYGLTRMFHFLAEETGWEMNVFRLREEAEAWIRKMVKERFNIDDLTMASA
jgi:hypothetical protein